MSQQIIDFTVTVLSGTEKRLLSSFSGPIMLDFWQSKCPHCPAALEKMEKLSKEYPEISFIAVALSKADKDANYEVGQENSLLEKEQEECVRELCLEWPELTHVFIDAPTKSVLKQFLSFSTVPFVVLLDKNHCIVQSGNPKTFDYSLLNSTTKSNETITTNNLQFDEDF